MLVQREVITCCSPLVDAIARNPETWRAMDLDEDRFLALQQTTDYEQVARDWVSTASAADLNDAFGLGLEYEGTDPDLEEVRRLADDELDKLGVREYEKFCRDMDLDIDDYGREAYEHWIVTPYLAGKLEEQGEIVGELFNWKIWGRCTTGQAICLDGVIERIASGMGILKGQKHEWK
jgi:hypothetical protein